MVVVRTEQRDALLAALEHGELDGSQLRQLIEIEADALGLTFDEAIERAYAGTLPPTPQGFDLQFHILMLST